MIASPDDAREMEQLGREIGAVGKWENGQRLNG